MIRNGFELFLSTIYIYFIYLMGDGAQCPIRRNTPLLDSSNTEVNIRLASKKNILSRNLRI